MCIICNLIALPRIFESKLLSKKSKTIFYKVLVRPTIIYAYDYERMLLRMLVIMERKFLR